MNHGTLFHQVPRSCCKYDENGKQTNCDQENVEVEKIYTSDCFASALKFVKGHSVVVGGVAVGIAAIMVKIFYKKNYTNILPIISYLQILGMVFSMCHYKLIERSN